MHKAYVYIALLVIFAGLANALFIDQLPSYADVLKDVENYGSQENIVIEGTNFLPARPSEFIPVTKATLNNRIDLMTAVANPNKQIALINDGDVIDFHFDQDLDASNDIVLVGEVLSGQPVARVMIFENGNNFVSDVELVTNEHNRVAFEGLASTTKIVSVSFSGGQFALHHAFDATAGLDLYIPDGIGFPFLESDPNVYNNDHIFWATYARNTNTTTFDYDVGFSLNDTRMTGTCGDGQYLDYAAFFNSCAITEYDGYLNCAGLGSAGFFFNWMTYQFCNAGTYNLSISINGTGPILNNYSIITTVADEPTQSTSTGTGLGTGIAFLSHDGRTRSLQSDLTQSFASTATLATLDGSSMNIGEDYFVFASAILAKGSSTEPDNFFLRYGGMTFTDMDPKMNTAFTSDYQSVANYVPIAMFTVFTANGSNITFEHETSFASDVASIELHAIPLGKLRRGVDYFFAEDTINFASCSDTYASNVGASIDFTADGKSDYMVFGSALFDIGNVADDLARMGIFHNGTQIATSEVDGSDANDRPVLSAFNIIESPDVGEVDISVRYQCDSTHDAIGSKVFVLRLNAFRTHSFVEDESTVLISETQDDEILTISTPLGAKNDAYFTFWGLNYQYDNVFPTNNARIQVTGDVDANTPFNTSSPRLITHQTTSQSEGADQSFIMSASVDSRSATTSTNISLNVWAEDDDTYQYNRNYAAVVGFTRVLESIDLEAGVHETQPINNVYRQPGNVKFPINYTDQNSAFSFVDINRSLVLWMTFDNVSGNTWYGNSSYANTASSASTGPNTTQGPGVYGQAAVFDAVYGSTGLQVSETVGDELDIRDQMTISVWLKRNVTTTQTALRHGVVADAIYTLTDDSFNWYDGSFPGRAFNGSDQYNWYHVVVTRDLPNIRMYVNGELDSVHTDGTSPTTNPGNLYIGRSGSVSQTWNGSIDEVMIFNRVLSESEIEALYSIGSDNYTLDLSNFVTEGTYNYTLYVKDKGTTLGDSGVITLGEYSITLDNTSPQVTLQGASPANGAFVTSSTITVNASVNEANPYTFFTDTGGDLLAWYDFETFTTTQVFDQSSYGRVGNLTNGAAQSDYGALGKALDATPTTNKRVLIPSGDYLNFTNVTKAITFWLKGNPITTQAGIFANTNDGGTNSIFIGATSGGDARVRVAGASGTALNFDSSPKIMVPNEWRHIAVIINDTYDSTDVSLYVNGVFGQTRTFSQSGDKYGGFPGFIGDTTSWLGMNGSIDELMIWNRSLTTSEIQNLYNTTSNPVYTLNISEATSYYTVYAKDYAGNLNSSNQNITVDLNPPTIAFVDPNLEDLGNQNYTLPVNISSSDANNHYVFNDIGSSQVLWWRFDNNASQGEDTSLAYDWSGIGNNATLSSASYTADAAFGNALSITSGYASVADNPTIDLVDAFTISWWAYPNNVSNSVDTMVSKGCFGDPTWYVDFNSGFLRYQMGGLSLTSIAASSYERTWTHFALTYSETEEEFYFYINGVQTDSGDVEDDPVTANAKPFVVGGRDCGSPAGTFEGYIDEVLILNRTLRSAEIAALYNASEYQHDVTLSSSTYIPYGENTHKGYVVDRAGHMRETETRTIFYDRTSPSLSINDNTPVDGSTIAQASAEINVSASDSFRKYSFIDFNNDLMLWLDFDVEYSENLPKDLSTYNNTLLRLNTPVQNDSGVYGKSARFDGTNDYYQIADFQGLDESTGVSVCSWVYLDELGTTDSIYDSGIFAHDITGPSGAVLLWYNINQDGTDDYVYTFNVGDTNSASNRISTPNSAAVAQTWQHVCGTMNGTNRTIYLDGVQSASTAAAAASAVPDLNSAASIGHWSGAATNFDMDGEIDELLVFNRTLTAFEIKQIYNTTADSYAVTFGSLDDAQYDYSAHVIDRAANRAVTSQSFSVDNTDPVIVYEDPTSSSSSNDINLTYNISVTDASDSKYGFVDFNDSLLVWLRYEEEYNTTPIDSGPLGLPIVVGAATDTPVDPTSPYGKGRVWADDLDWYYIDQSDSPLGGVTEFTMSAWINSSANEENRIIGTRNAATSERMTFSIKSGGEIRFHIENGGGTYQTHDSDNLATSLNVWRHVAVTFNTTNGITFYENGQEVGTAQSTTTPPLNGRRISFGWQYQDADTTRWKGSLDEQMIFGRALAATEIAALYNMSAGHFNHTHENIPLGTYNTTAYAVDAAGNMAVAYNTTTVTTDVSACGTLNRPDTEYSLIANITSDDSPCILIAANNVSFNGSGNSLSRATLPTSASRYGIYSSSYSNISFLNTVLYNYSYGIYSAGDNHLIQGNIIYPYFGSPGFCFSVTAIGIGMASNGGLVNNNSILDGWYSGCGSTSTTYGIYLWSSSGSTGGTATDNIVTADTSSSRGGGIYIATDDAVVDDLTLSDLPNLGVYAYRPDNLSVSNVVGTNVYGNDPGFFSVGTDFPGAIKLNTATNSTIENVSFTNGDRGVALIQGAELTLTNVTITNMTSDTSHDVFLAGTNGVYFYDLTINDAEDDGVITITSYTPGDLSYTSTTNTLFNNTNIYPKIYEDLDITGVGATTYNVTIQGGNIGEYNFNSFNGLNFSDSTWGSIYIDDTLSASGSNLSATYLISQNYTFVNVTEQGDFDTNAIVHMDNWNTTAIPTYVAILNNSGHVCSTCSNSTPLTQQSVVFTTTAWQDAGGTTGFHLGQDPTQVTECGTLQPDNIYVRLMNDVTSTGTCFTIGANNVTLDGQGNLVNYASSLTGHAIEGVTQHNFTLKNIEINRSSYLSQTTASYSGIELTNVDDTTISNVTIQPTLTDFGLFIQLSDNMLVEDSDFQTLQNYTFYAITSDNISLENTYVVADKLAFLSTVSNLTINNSVFVATQEAAFSSIGNNVTIENSSFTAANNTLSVTGTSELINNNITATNGIAYQVGGDDVNLTGGRINATTYALRMYESVDDSYGTEIFNTTFDNSRAVLVDGSSVTFTADIYTSNATSFDDDSTGLGFSNVANYYYQRANITNPFGTAVRNANVTFESQFGVFWFETSSILTANSGLTGTVPEIFNNLGPVIDPTSWRFNATKTGFVTNSTTYTPNGNKITSLTLYYNESPSINEQTPSNPHVVYEYVDINFSVNFTNPNGDNEITWYIDGSTQSSNITSSMNTSSFYWGGNLSSEGVYNVTVVVANTIGNDSYSWNVTKNEIGVGTLTLSDSSSVESISRGSAFTYTVNATCLNGFCSNVRIYIDPQPEGDSSDSLYYLMLIIAGSGIAVVSYRKIKGQASTEYIVIGAVVLIITGVVVSTLSAVSLSSPDAAKRAMDTKLQSQDIAIIAHSIDTNQLILDLQNTQATALKVSSVVIDGLTITSGQLPVVLSPGQQERIFTSTIRGSSVGATYSLPIEITYSNVRTGAQDTTPEGLLLLGTVGELTQYEKGILTTNSGSVPFYLNESQNYYDCGTLSIDESCVNTFNIVATGGEGSWGVFSMGYISSAPPALADAEAERTYINIVD